MAAPILTRAIVWALGLLLAAPLLAQSVGRGGVPGGLYSKFLDVGHPGLCLRDEFALLVGLAISR